MRVRVTPGARRQIQQIHDYIAADNPAAARTVVARIAVVAALLGENPGMGRKLPEGRLHRFPVRPYPYLIYYEITADEVRIIRAPRGTLQVRFS